MIKNMDMELNMIIREIKYTRVNSRITKDMDLVNHTIVMDVYGIQAYG